MPETASVARRVADAWRPQRETAGAARLRQAAPWPPVQVSRRVTLRLNTGVVALWS